MTLTLSLFALTLLFSFGILLLNILSAPEGYEDATGFHAVAEVNANGSGRIAGNRPQVIPVYAKSVTQHGLL